MQVVIIISSLFPLELKKIETYLLAKRFEKRSLPSISYPETFQVTISDSKKLNRNEVP